MPPPCPPCGRSGDRLGTSQVFVTDEEWAAVLRAVMRPCGPGAVWRSSRDPAQKAWLGWNRGQTYQRVVIPDAGPVRRG
jgi:hypothetical protein